MGLIRFGVPGKEAKYLKQSLKLDIFVEGGTYKGDTARSMSHKFQKVYTIEKSDVMFDIARESLKDISNITMFKGDTREYLHNILEQNDNILFWLDAHWSGGETYGEEDECPLIEELEIIFEYNKNYAILIDDARLFSAPPPHPHKVEKWPSLKDIVNSMPNNWDIVEFEDVIYLFNNQQSSHFRLFIQEIVTERWKEYGEESKGSFVKGIKVAIRGLLNGKML